MKQFTMTVSKKEGGEFKEVGSVVAFVPLLSEVGYPAEPSKLDDDGFPVYEDEKAQYTFDCLLAAVKAAARNKLQKGSAELKPGAKIAETLAELIEGGGGNKGEGLANRREAIAAFAKFIAASGKSEAWIKSAVSLFSNAEALRLSEDKKRTGMEKQILAFAETLTEEQAVKFKRTLEVLIEATKGDDTGDDWE